jgi:Bax protein
MPVPRLRARRSWLLGGVGLALAVLVATLSLLSRKGMPDFREYEAGPDRKGEFLGFLRPMIEAENARVLEDRRRLEELAERADLGWLDRWWLDGLAGDYGLDPEESDDEALVEALRLRVDAVPVSLALAQAAKESGWGTSRFARKGYNLFGQRCYEPGCGLVPRSRDPGRRHEVAAFASPEESVASYVRNINTHDGYQGFREERARLRAAGQRLSGVLLADELDRYSERREDYIREVKRMIRVNDLEELSEGSGG